MSDPISRLQLAQQEIDKTFGAGFAEQHPEAVGAVMISASLDWAAMTIGTGGTLQAPLSALSLSGLLRRIDADGKRQDAELHEEIFRQGDDAPGKAISDKISRSVSSRRAGNRLRLRAVAACFGAVAIEVCLRHGPRRWAAPALSFRVRAALHAVF